MRGPGDTLEDLSYTRDCLGHIIRKTNSAQQDAYFRNCKVEPVLEYSYVGFGQLKTATGREQLNGTGGALSPTPQEHRRVILNRLTAAKCVSISRPTSMTLLEISYKCAMTRCRIPPCLDGTSTFNNMLQSSSTQIVNSGTPDQTFYCYDHAGTRVRKITERSAAEGEAPVILKETLYIRGAEIYITYSGKGQQRSSRCTSEITGSSQMALLESNSAFKEDVLIRYQVNDRIELDDNGLVVSYEEHSPFGSSTFSLRKQKVQAPRKYRFAAYLRDNETGFYLCGARYYAPWLGRWIPLGPLGQIDGPNLYVYVANNPVNYNDPSGTMKFEFLMSDEEKLAHWTAKGAQM
jgi:RHS repeat-associated protein